MSEIKPYSLSTVLTSVKNCIDKATGGKSFWIKAEIADIKHHKPSGHCYIGLVETRDNKQIAQCNATIWSRNLSTIQNELQSDFNNILKKGNEFLCLATIDFHQLYGLRIDIQKVDKSFTLGKLEINKQETIDKLKKEGVFDTNKLKIPPIVIKRVALITSVSTSGYADFHKQVDNNKYGYKFEIVDFDATVQGDKAVGEICKRLEYLNNQRFDIVAIIRGGGSKLDLDVFNNYTLAKIVATHNLPIYTGIGHETDVSVVDMVASMQHKTPTALGAYIVEQAHNFHIRVSNTWTAIREFQNLYFETQKNWLKLNIQTLTSESISKTRLKRGDLHTVQTRINTEVMEIINSEKGKLIDAKALISSKPVFILSNQRQLLKNNIQVVHLNFQDKIKQATVSNNHALQMIITHAKNKCKFARGTMNYYFEAIQIYKPSNILKKGYAIPLYRGKLYREQPLKFKEELEIELLNQTLVVSFINSKKHGKYQL